MNAPDREILLELLGYCNKIRDRIDEFDIDKTLFAENSALFDMLLMPLFQIGELTGALSDEYTKSHTEIPWHAIKGFRNIIAPRVCFACLIR